MIQELTTFVDARVDDLVDLAARLVRERSVLGAEEGAQRIVEERLQRLGFAVERVEPDADAARLDPHGGYPALSYRGRSCVAGRLAGGGRGRSLHLSGHVDVVPVEAEELWRHGPWAGAVADGRLWGRGAGDMKGGLAAYLLAVEALLAVCGRPAGDLVFSSVIEEENGGNGMRAVLSAGYEGDATLIGEPTGLALVHGGAGVIWARLTALGRGGHARLTPPGEAPLEQIVRAVEALRGVERLLNEGSPGQPYRVNLGEIHGGVWPSSQPASVILRVRVGFGLEREPSEVQEILRDAVHAVTPEIDVVFDGFRAHAYRHEISSPFVTLVRDCHREVVGTEAEPLVWAGTTDARYVREPVACYGPLAGNQHGTDEWVDLETVRLTAVTVAVTAARWCQET